MAVTSGKTEALSNVDSAWLRMEDPTNLMTITGLMAFEEKLEFARLKRDIEDRLLPIDRFRQRVVQSRLPLAKPRWQEDEHFALSAHLRRLALPHPAPLRLDNRADLLDGSIELMVAIDHHIGEFGQPAHLFLDRVS